MKKKYKRADSSIKFSKKIVVFCIIFIIIYTVAHSICNFCLGVEVSPTLTTCVYAFFGTELAASALIRIFDQDNKNKKSDNDA